MTSRKRTIVSVLTVVLVVSVAWKYKQDIYGYSTYFGLTTGEESDMDANMNSDTQMIMNQTKAKGDLEMKIDNEDEATVYNANTDKDRITSVNKHTDVLLFTYMRGGSTFVGEILAQNRETFYVYEPLFSYGPFLYFGANGTCKQNSDVCRVDPSMTKERVVDIMMSISQCQLNNIKRVEDKLRSLKGGLSWDDYNNCKKNYGGADKCHDILVKSCLKSKFRISKVHRLSMDIVETIMKKLKTMKVIYLLRDPRVVMMSRNNGSMKVMYWKLETSVPALCHKMSKDLKEAMELEKHYPTRFKLITYESLVREPLTRTAELYDFLKFSYDEGDLYRVYNMKHAPFGASEPFYETIRQNSTNITLRWMEHMDSRIVQIADKHCSYVYELLGYYKPNSSL